MGAIIVSGLVSGALYALVAAGLSLIWGSLGVFNFAHGVLLMAGAYVAWWISAPDGLGLGLPVAILGALAFMMFLGVLLYVLLVRPWIGKTNAELAVIMTTIAASIFVQNLVLEVFGDPGATATISYLDVDARPQQVDGATLPWSYEDSTTKPAVVVNIVAQGDGSTLGCRIIVDGVVKAENTVNTPGAYTYCLDKSG